MKKKHNFICDHDYNDELDEEKGNIIQQIKNMIKNKNQLTTESINFTHCGEF